MGKIPSFQYYPNDWRADPVFSCSLAARGLWHEMMNMMHVSERYGYLSINGEPVPPEAIARYCACESLEQYLTLLAELDRSNVPRRTTSGIIFSKRMVEDQKKRLKWRKDQQNHRDRIEMKSGASQHDVRSMSRSSSSSSSSSSSKQLQNLGPHTPRPVHPSGRKLEKLTKDLQPQQVRYGQVSKLITGAMLILAKAKEMGSPIGAGELKERLKDWAASAGIEYDADSVSKALDVVDEKAKALV